MLSGLRSSIFLLLLVLPRVNAQELIHITNGEWPPYLSQSLPGFGLASQIVKEAFEAENIKVKWLFAPWARSYELAKNENQWYASAVWSDAPDARQHFHFSDEVITTSNVFYYRKDHDFDWQSFYDLNGKVIGVTRNYNYGEEFYKAIAEQDVVLSEVTSDEQNFSMLLKGRIDIFANDPLVGQEQIATLFNAAEQSQLVAHPKKFAERGLYLIISKNAPNGQKLLERFNKGLATLKKQGRLNALYQQLESGYYSAKSNPIK